MTQFNLEEYKKNPNRKVVTERNKKVRIICTDINCAYPIIAAVKINDRETPLSYDINGKCPFYEGNDLFFADEEEKLSDFELRLLSSLDYTRKFRQNLSNEHMLKVTKDIAKELLELARKEILKDLPRYKKAEESKVLDWVVKLTEDGNIIFSDVVYKGEYFIMLQSLKTLPMED